MLNKIVLDLETQKDFSEVAAKNRNRLLRVSVAGVYFYQTDQFQCFEEKELTRLGEMLSRADQVIGYNIKGFDFEVLQPYLNFPLKDLPALDILEEIEKILGHRIRLEAVAQATLGTGKTGSGRQAIDLWRTGQIQELKDYCLKDVELTRDLYNYGQANGKLLFQDFFATREIPLNFPEPLARINVITQASLF